MQVLDRKGKENTYNLPLVVSAFSVHKFMSQSITVKSPYVTSLFSTFIHQLLAKSPAAHTTIEINVQNNAVTLDNRSPSITDVTCLNESQLRSDSKIQMFRPLCAIPLRVTYFAT